MTWVNGGEGGIRTPDSLTTMPDFESGAFNRALPPLRTFYCAFVWPETEARTLDPISRRVVTESKGAQFLCVRHTGHHL